MLLSFTQNPNPSYSRFAFVLSAVRRINYFVLNEVESFRSCASLCFSGYLFKVTEAEQEEGSQPRHQPKKRNLKKALTSTIEATVIIQVVAIVIADLLLWVGEHSEGLTHLLEFLFLLLLHLRSRCTVAVCGTNKTQTSRKITFRYYKNWHPACEDQDGYLGGA